MTSEDDREGFLARWSRLKAQRASQICEHQPRTGSEEANGRHEGANHSPSLSDLTQPAEEGVLRDQSEEASLQSHDKALEGLPAIEEITAETDLSDWLKKPVPAEWRIAALRKMFSVDPMISTFIGPADYAWDWNAPDGVPGFGPLSSTDNIATLVEQATGFFQPGSVSDAEGKNEPSQVSRSPQSEPQEAAQIDAEPEVVESAELSSTSRDDNGTKSENFSKSITYYRRAGSALPH
jgi:hypothetical protein